MDCAEIRPALSRRLDGELDVEGAIILEAHLGGCAACRVLRGELGAEQALLAERWPPVGAPAGFADRVAAALPPRSDRRRPPRWLAAAALLIGLLAAGALFQPTALASVGLLLRQVVLRESPPPAGPPRALPMARLRFEEAQALVPWPIRRPTVLPDGYLLVAVYAGEIHAFAVGPTVVLEYQQGDGPAARHLALTQLRAAADVPEDVEPGAARQVEVGRDRGLFVDGRWIEQDGRRAWEQGTLVRLIVEQDDLVIQLEADPRDGWDADRLAQVAASLSE